MAWCALLWCERQRLPLQNVAALGVISMGLGMAMEWGITHGAGNAAWGPDGWRMATSWALAWLGARAMARCMGAGGLGRRTLLLGLLFLPGLERLAMISDWPGAAREAGWLAVRGVAMASGFLVLGPWWIRKQASSSRPAPWFAGWIAPTVAMVHAMLLSVAGPDGWREAVPIAAGAMVAGWTGIVRPRAGTA